MSDYFYSLHMLVTGRMHDLKYWGAMDTLAECIADDEKELPAYAQFLLPKD